MNVRTATLMLAAIGLVTMAIGAPGAAAQTEVPGEDPGQCAQVYLFEYSVGPVTVDASDACPNVIVEDPALATKDFPPTVCIYPFGC